eukprot:TRINITY_DN8825_c0_g1_i1.p1 TRINITY_DN8825_c0_g1~~TRINITY_DN8825_c0_g1_i1.p1  ORF type:complete len:423 (+),score=95.90 TRINITY_DN8825_c0_g1_i1:96-1364(+)
MHNNQKTIVAFGQTGAGKSTMLNMLAGCYFKLKSGNITRAIDLYEPIPAPTKIFSTSAGADSCTSITNSVETNWFGNPDHPNLVLIDTAGLGDSRGILQDSANISQMVQKLKEMEIGVDLFLIVVNAHNRFDQELAEFIRIFQQIFGQDVWKNTSLLFTHWDGNEDARMNRQDSSPPGLEPEAHKNNEFCARIAAITGGQTPTGSFFMDCNPRLRREHAEGTILNMRRIYTVAMSSTPFSCKDATTAVREKQRLQEAAEAAAKAEVEAVKRAKEAEETARKEAEKRVEAERLRSEAEKARAVAERDRAAAERQRAETERISREKQEAANKAAAEAKDRELARLNSSLSFCGRWSKATNQHVITISYLGDKFVVDGLDGGNRASGHINSENCLIVPTARWGSVRFKVINQDLLDEPGEGLERG